MFKSNLAYRHVLNRIICLRRIRNSQYVLVRNKENDKYCGEFNLIVSVFADKITKTWYTTLKHIICLTKIPTKWICWQLIKPFLLTLIFFLWEQLHIHDNVWHFFFTSWKKYFFISWFFLYIIICPKLIFKVCFSVDSRNKRQCTQNTQKKGHGKNYFTVSKFLLTCTTVQNTS